MWIHLRVSVNDKVHSTYYTSVHCMYNMNNNTPTCGVSAISSQKICMMYYIIIL